VLPCRYPALLTPQAQVGSCILPFKICETSCPSENKIPTGFEKRELFKKIT